MKILLTGASGFVGPHLARYIESRNEEHKVYGTVKNRSDLSKIPQNVTVVECELTDPKNVDDVIREIKPDIIFHLAAQSFVQTSWKSPADTLTNNIISELNVLEAVRKFAPECIVQVACSSEEYGAPKRTPIFEIDPLNPLSPYGVSKVAQEKLGYQYHKSYGLKIVLTRAFNHTGPGRDPRFAEASFAQQIAQGGVLKHGNLEAVRDYTDVRDMVRAYWLAATSEVYGTPLNICSGVGHSMDEVIVALLKAAGRDQIAMLEDPERMRPSDIPILIGRNEVFCTLTDWKPEIPFEQTMADLYKSFL